MPQQLSLIKQDLEYGGDHRTGKAKQRRPLSTRKPIHVTLRSSKAKGEYSLRRHRNEIEKILEAQSQRWRIRLYRKSINRNHIHLALRGKRREEIQNFFRAIAGLIARLVTGAQKGRAFGRFWDRTLWSRIAEWGKAFDTLTDYVFKNVLESEGLVPYFRKSNRKESVLRL